MFDKAEWTLAEVAVVAESVTLTVAEDTDMYGAAEAVPVALDEVIPGPGLAQVLSTLDLSSLSGHDRVTVLRTCQRLANQVQALVYEAMGSIADAYLERDEPVLSGGDRRRDSCRTVSDPPGGRIRTVHRPGSVFPAAPPA